MLIKELYEVDFNFDGYSTVIKVTEDAFYQIKDGFALHHEIVKSFSDDMDLPFDDVGLPDMLEIQWYYKQSDGLLVHFGHTVECVAYRGDYEFKEDL